MLGVVGHKEAARAHRAGSVPKAQLAEAQTFHTTPVQSPLHFGVCLSSSRGLGTDFEV